MDFFTYNPPDFLIASTIDFICSNYGIHRVLLEIHLLREGERFLGLGLQHNHHTIAVCRDDIA
jgi:hypothetical protein